MKMISFYLIYYFYWTHARLIYLTKMIYSFYYFKISVLRTRNMEPRWTPSVTLISCLSIQTFYCPTGRIYPHDGFPTLWQNSQSFIDPVTQNTRKSWCETSSFGRRGNWTAIQYLCDASCYRRQLLWCCCTELKSTYGKQFPLKKETIHQITWKSDLFFLNEIHLFFKK